MTRVLDDEARGGDRDGKCQQKQHQEFHGAGLSLRAVSRASRAAPVGGGS